MTSPMDHARRTFVAWAAWGGVTFRLWLRLGLATARPA